MSLNLDAGDAPLPPPPPAPKSKPRGGERYPVARPAPPAPKLRDSGEPEQADLVEDLLSPPSLRSFALSIGAHALLLLILAFWYFSPIQAVQKVIDTRLAGSELGDPNGDQLKGALGMDTPIAMPQSPVGPVLERVEEDRITSLPVEDVTAPAVERPRPDTKDTAANGGGVSLTGTGGGAGSGDGFGIAKFGQGGENINGVEVKVGDPQFTLIWDSRADIDLHVVEPGGSEIYWENRLGGQGGELDVDDVDGFGPENVNYAQGVGPPGAYRWFVHYYGGLGGLAQNTRWKVRVKHGGKIDVYQGKLSAIGQKSQVYTLKVSDRGNRGGKSTDAKETPEGGRVANAPPASAAPAPAPAARRAGPTVFSPPDSGFSVTLPGEPKGGRNDWETPLGAVVGQTYTFDAPDGGISVTTLDFPATTLAKADKDKFLLDMAGLVAHREKGTPTRQSSVTVEKAAGRDVEFTLPESVVAGGGVGRARLVLVGNRLVILTALGAKSFLDGPDASEAFRTFNVSASR